MMLLAIVVLLSGCASSGNAPASTPPAGAPTPAATLSQQPVAVTSTTPHPTPTNPALHLDAVVQSSDPDEFYAWTATISRGTATDIQVAGSFHLIILNWSGVAFDRSFHFNATDFQTPVRGGFAIHFNLPWSRLGAVWDKTFLDWNLSFESDDHEKTNIIEGPNLPPQVFRPFSDRFEVTVINWTVIPKPYGQAVAVNLSIVCRGIPSQKMYAYDISVGDQTPTAWAPDMKDDDVLDTYQCKLGGTGNWTVMFYVGAARTIPSSVVYNHAYSEPWAKGEWALEATTRLT